MDDNKTPTESYIKEFYEEIYNPQGIDIVEPTYFLINVSIPIFDYDITVHEVQKLKVDKAYGSDGLSPRIIQILPVQWIHFILTVFNAVFSSGSCPALWQPARMFLIKKKGNRTVQKNYRGKNIINCLAELYDMMLSTLLSLWLESRLEVSETVAALNTLLR